MKTHKLLQVALVAALGCATARLAADPGAWTLEPHDVPILQSYEGPGTVALLDNGEAVVFLGTESEPFDTMILAPEDPSAFSLVEEGSTAFIRPTRRARSTGTVTAFVESADETPTALRAFTGRLKVTVANGETIAVQVRDAEGVTFTHEWALVEVGSPMFTRLVPVSSLSTSGDEVGRAAGDDQKNETTCTANCTNGSSAHTCLAKRGCYAYCDLNGEPKSGCGKRTAVV